MSKMAKKPEGEWEVDIWEKHRAMFPEYRREVSASLTYEQVSYLLELLSAEADAEEEDKDGQPVAKFIREALSNALHHASSELMKEIEAEEDRQITVKDRREAKAGWHDFMRECKAAVKGSRRRA
jgi:hypothetical protein